MERPSYRLKKFLILRGKPLASEKVSGYFGGTNLFYAKINSIGRVLPAAVGMPKVVSQNPARLAARKADAR